MAGESEPTQPDPRPLPTLRGLSFSETEIANAKSLGHPLSLSVELPCECDLNCIYCYTDGGRVCFSPQESNPQKLSPEELEGLVKQAALLHVETINIVGAGEPLKYQDKKADGGSFGIKEFIELVERYKMWVVLYTNNTEVNDSMAQWLYDHDVSVMATLNSWDGDTRARLAGVSNLLADGIERGLRTLERAFRPKTDDEKAAGVCRLGISMFVCKDNLKTIPELFNYARANGLFPLVCRLLNCGRARGHGLDVTDLEFRKLAYKLKEIDASNGYDWEPTPSYVYFHCRSFAYHMVIDQYGDGRPCFGVFERVGSVRDKGTIQPRALKDLWDSKLMKKSREVKQHIKGACRTCRKIDDCYGCRCRTYAATKDAFATDSSCWFATKSEAEPRSISMYQDTALDAFVDRLVATIDANLRGMEVGKGLSDSGLVVKFHLPESNDTVLSGRTCRDMRALLGSQSNVTIDTLRAEGHSPLYYAATREADNRHEGALPEVADDDGRIICTLPYPISDTLQSHIIGNNRGESGFLKQLGKDMEDGWGALRSVSSDIGPVDIIGHWLDCLAAAAAARLVGLAPASCISFMKLNNADTLKVIPHTEQKRYIAMVEATDPEHYASLPKLSPAATQYKLRKRAQKVHGWMIHELADKEYRATGKHQSRVAGLWRGTYVRGIASNDCEVHAIDLDGGKDWADFATEYVAEALAYFHLSKVWVAHSKWGAMVLPLAPGVVDSGGADMTQYVRPFGMAASKILEVEAKNRAGGGTLVELREAMQEDAKHALCSMLSGLDPRKLEAAERLHDWLRDSLSQGIPEVTDHGYVHLAGMLKTLEHLMADYGDELKVKTEEHYTDFVYCMILAVMLHDVGMTNDALAYARLVGGDVDYKRKRAEHPKDLLTGWLRVHRGEIMECGISSHEIDVAHTIAALHSKSMSEESGLSLKNELRQECELHGLDPDSKELPLDLMVVFLRILDASDVAWVRVVGREKIDDSIRIVNERMKQIELECGSKGEQHVDDARHMRQEQNLHFFEEALLHRKKHEPFSKTLVHKPYFVLVPHVRRRMPVRKADGTTDYVEQEVSWDEVRKAFDGTSLTFLGEKSRLPYAISGPRDDIDAELNAPGVQEILSQHNLKILGLRLFDPGLDSKIFDLAYPT